MPVNIKSISDRQVLTLGKAILDYEYIQNHRADVLDDDFQDVYYDFYLKSRWAQIGKKHGEKWNAYFEVLKDVMETTEKDSTLLDVLEKLKEKNMSNVYEFSIASKLLHTKNTNVPIFDSKVYNFLKKDENVPLQWGENAKSDTKRAQIEHDWKLINDWYDNFLINDSRHEEWLSWFNEKFPQHNSISDVKKIDFIIFICN